jgi:hypothetical protein
LDSTDIANVDKLHVLIIILDNDNITLGIPRIRRTRLNPLDNGSVCVLLFIPSGIGTRESANVRKSRILPGIFIQKDLISFT